MSYGRLAWLFTADASLLPSWYGAINVLNEHSSFNNDASLQMPWFGALGRIQFRSKIATTVARVCQVMYAKQV
jgi:hypothetical protein